MYRSPGLIHCILLTALLAALMPLHAAMVPGTPFSDGMVLQRQMDLPVWGWTDPGRDVSVTLAGQTATATADEQGFWRVTLPAMEAGGPHEMVITSGDERLVIRDILVGEVWLASGQSNMAMPVRDVENAAEEIAAANDPMLRMLGVRVQGSGLPQHKPTGRRPQWQQAVADQVGTMSATAYFFARELRRELDVPVGVLVIATGATNIEIWTPREGLAQVPELIRWHNTAEQIDKQYRQDMEAFAAELAAWQAAQAAGTATPRPQEPVHPFTVRNDPMRNLGSLFNGSVAQLAPYAIRGMIWYQGESNRDDLGRHYYNFKRALIGGWRAVWDQGDFPVYFVQIGALIAPWRPFWHIPEIWEGQTWSLEIPNTGMAVIHDLCGDLKNIHPTNKQDVGKRLALWPLARDYGQSERAYAGPIYRRHQIQGDQVIIEFDYAFDGLKTRDGQPVNWFTMAGEDGVFHSAVAQIQGETIILHSESVPEPVAVRFAWEGSAQPNLINGAGLPAGAFRIGPTHWPY